MAKRVFRAALRLFPRWFRVRYGDDMRRDFERRLQHAKAQAGVPGVVGFLVRAHVDVLIEALRVRRVRRGGAPSPDGYGWVDDMRNAVRSVARAPGWTAAALTILILGIGGTAAVFSVLDGILLRPLPYEDPATLVSLWTVNRVQDLPDGSSWENARDWTERSRAVADFTLYIRPEFTTATVSSSSGTERIHVGQVAPNFFELLGVDAIAGRMFSDADADADARVGVISERLWTTRYGADPAVVGKTATVSGEEVRILGVAPAALAIPGEDTEIWLLHDPRSPDGTDRRNWDAYVVLGRLAHGATIEGAQTELDRVARELADEYPVADANHGVRVRSLQAEIVGDRLPLLLWTLLGSMALVLAVGATNVAQLLVGRGLDRRREMAVRTALGATQTRIRRQLVFEGLLLSLVAAVGGVVLARIGLAGLVGLIPPDVPRTASIAIDKQVLLACLGAALLLVPLVGLLPALWGSRFNAAPVLRAGGRGATPLDRGVRSVLVVGEVAMAVVLLSGAGLLVRSAIEIQAIDPGFDARHTLVARLDLDGTDRGEDVQATLGTLLERLRARPDVVGAGFIQQFFIERFPDQTITLAGDAPRDPSEPAPRLTSDLVSADFFGALGLPLLRGEGLRPSGDADGRIAQAVVNRAWVDTFAEGRDPVGLQFRWGRRVEGDFVTVVGVVGDVRRTTLEEPAYPQIFLTGANSQEDLVIRTTGSPANVVPFLRATVRELDPGAALSRVDSVWDRYGEGLARRRFQTLLFGAFAALATLLAAIGLFGVLHDAVASRRREIGIRLALGAAPGRVRRMVLRSGIGLTLAGVGIGLVGVVALSSVTNRLVYGIGGTDPLTLSLAVSFLLTVSILAAVLPAVQATRVAPTETLSAE